MAGWTASTNYHTLNLEQAPTGPYAIVEFRGGSFDPWVGPGFGKCTSLLNQEFERVFHKNDFSFGVTIFMTYGGTNWGNLGHPGGYTSYGHGAVIAEDLTVSREKYSEAEFKVSFLMASPPYTTATPGNGSNDSYVDTSTSSWPAGSPVASMPAPGVRLYTTSFDLDMPTGYDIPLLFVFKNGTTGNASDSNYRSMLFVNEYQFGKVCAQYRAAG